MKNDWIEESGALQKIFEFADFKEALAFVNRVGEIAERLQHHPDVGVKDYRKVFVSTTTHDNGSTVTAKDRELADQIDKVVGF